MQCLGTANGIYNLIAEPLKNANFHSQSDRNTVVSLFQCQRAIVWGYNDGGEYFKRNDVKLSVERERKHLGKHQANHPEIGHGVGGDFLECFDIVHVDSLQGTLYTGLSIPDKLMIFRRLI